MMERVPSKNQPLTQLEPDRPNRQAFLKVRVAHIQRINAFALVELGDGVHNPVHRDRGSQPRWLYTTRLQSCIDTATRPQPILVRKSAPGSVRARTLGRIRGLTR
jgi:hypothetical protein